jgi:DNA recombination protein RmuC
MVTILLLVLLFAAAGVGVYGMTEARRWRQEAIRVRQESDVQRAEAQAQHNRAVTAEAQLQAVSRSQAQWEEKFRTLAADTLHNNSQLLLDRSRAEMQRVVEPVSQTLKQFEEHVRQLEAERAGAYQGLTAQVGTLLQLQERVRQSTDELKNALRSPIQRGRWGEVQLRRVVEMAGMLEYCDFDQQKTLFGESNARPDLIVRMPNNCQIVVDAKVSLDAYLRAIETPDERERERFFADHARQVGTHVKSLSEKSYWDRLPGSPDFVVAFLPLESLFSAALQYDPTLLETGAQRRVILATPTTLITLLLTVAHGWRQHALGENAERIRRVGIELHDRVATMTDHFERLGDFIGKTVAAYNSTVASMERNVLSSVRKFRELKPAADPIVEIEQIDGATKAIDATKWIA